MSCDISSSETIVQLGRLNALSDGVFAIALTLLALDIRIPDNTLAGELSARLVELGPKLLIYLISFMNWRYPWAWELPTLDWKLNLNPTIPLALHIQKAAGKVDLDFTKTQLTDLRIEVPTVPSIFGSLPTQARLPSTSRPVALHS